MEISDWKWNNGTMDAIYPICLPETDYDETWKKGRTVAENFFLMFDAFFRLCSWSWDGEAKTLSDYKPRA